MGFPPVLSEDATLDAAIAGRSIARLGEGELKLAVDGMNLKSQPYDAKLAREIKAITSEPGPALACLPRFWKGMPNEPFWRRYLTSPFATLYRLPQYGSAFISRPDMVNEIDRPDYWDKAALLWKGKDVTLVSHGLKVMRMPEAASVRLVSCPPVGAYAEIDRIEEETGRPAGPVVLCAGAAATVLAARLAARGLHALDLGHLGHFAPHAGAYRVGSSDLISPEYVEQNRRLHARPEGYGGSGRKSADIVAAFAAEVGAVRVLDYGCGQGTLKHALRAKGFTPDIIEYDPAIQGKNLLPKPACLVTCTDVLEHVEPSKLAIVLAHIHSLTKVAAYFLIATRPAQKHLDDGRNAHLIVEPAEFWRGKIEEASFCIEREECKVGHSVKFWLRKQDE